MARDTATEPTSTLRVRSTKESGNRAIGFEMAKNDSMASFRECFSRVEAIASWRQIRWRMEKREAVDSGGHQKAIVKIQTGLKNQNEYKNINKK